MVLYNESFLNNATNFLQLTQGLSSSIMITDIVGNVIILTTFAILLLVLGNRYDLRLVLVSDFFVMAFLGTLGYHAGFVSQWVPSAGFAGMALMMLLYFFS